MSQSILFLAHVAEDGNTLPKASYEVLGAAVKLTKQLGARLTIGLIGEDVTAAAETIAAAGADRILAVAGPDFATARYASDAAAAEAICRAAGAELILAPATSRFMRVLPGVAHRLNGCVDTHVTALEADTIDGELRATRWHYRQRIEAVIRRDAAPLDRVARVRLRSGLGQRSNGQLSTANELDRSARRGQSRTDSGRTSASRHKNGRQRSSRSEKRRANHPARRRLAVCRGRGLDQEAGRRKDPCRPKRKP